MLKYKAILFDHDGTLIDSEVISTWSWKQAAKKHNANLDDEKIKKMKGSNVPMAKIIFDGFFNGNPSFDIVKKTRDEEFFFPYVKKNGIPLKEGAIEILEYCKEKGYRLCLCTSAPQYYADEFLHRNDIYKYFETFVYGTMVGLGKPNPEIFQLACKSLNVDPKDCLVIEDSINGVIAGHDAGCSVIGVPDTIPFNKETLPICDYVENSLLDVIKLLEKMEEED